MRGTNDIYSQSQATLATSTLQRSSTLGSGKTLTHEERLEQEEDKETRKALDGRIGKRKRARDEFDVVNGPDIESDDEDDFLASRPNRSHEPSSPQRDVVMEHPLVVVDSSNSHVKPQEVGSALKRNADGTVAPPKVRQRTKSKQVSVAIFDA